MQAILNYRSFDPTTRQAQMSQQMDYEYGVTLTSAGN